ncbi:dTDP-4-dehydrorhamnose reductase [Desulfurococcus mucosus]|uniref:dTDP-4-dehydrorhamnose reductase n=1 Tax=Desulfurococcus mucosus (strain ATCC 35584 / DSM 2162 / JCM 9187 / O7/1) TaxID=765177 RepID=E8RAK8_DESM0|nr:dTDP-4-dehydrorhamnose reductase [Desulfurococcus mucosus]ADV65444.1 dTDP-4-dehydrorhamnose reductase [Desulfurococcus mucosus DSM 2162]
MRILVTGGTGLLGLWVTKVFLERGYEVYASHHERKPVGLDGVTWEQMNLEDFKSVADTVKRVKPDAIIHTAAFTDVDGCEEKKELAYRVNYLATRIIAETARELNAYLVYISTDYVFDGERGMYREFDAPAPVNYYGLTKLLGEVAVNTLAPRSLIVRVSGLYGFSPTGKRNFGLVALEKLMNNEQVDAFHDQYLSPTYVRPLAERIADMVKREVVGVIHVAGERASRYEFASKLAEALGVPRDLVKKTSIKNAGLRARRPRDSSLDTGRAASMGLSIPPMNECIKSFINDYLANKVV